MLNTRNEENNTVFYSYLAHFVNTVTLNVYISMSYRVNQAEYVIHILVVAPQVCQNTRGEETLKWGRYPTC